MTATDLQEQTISEHTLPPAQVSIVKGAQEKSNEEICKHHQDQ